MSVEEVKEQISYVALVTKQASQVSDLRLHEFSAQSVHAPVVYFRGWSPGVCTYFDDRKGNATLYPHGACWYNRCDDLRVIDVPGDHFSLLRQDEEDMSLLITALKMVLGPFGWSEMIHHEDKKAFEVAPAEIQDVDEYLRRMGVKDSALRQRVEASMPYASSDGVTSALEAAARAAQQPVAPVNQSAREMASKQGAVIDQQPVLIVCCDANGTLSGMGKVFSLLDTPVFQLRVPADDALWESQEMAEIANVAIKAIHRSLPQAASPVLLSGVGFGAVLAHELAVQMDKVSDRVALLALFEGAHTVSNPDTSLNWLSPETRQATCQAAGALYDIVRTAAKDATPSMDIFAARMASIQGFDAQLDYIASFRPQEQELAIWDQDVDRILARLGYYKTIVDGYKAADIYNGQTLVFASSPSVVSMGGPAGAWESIRYLIQPAAFHEVKLLDGTQTIVSGVAANISDALRKAMDRRYEAEESAVLNGVDNSLALMSPKAPDSTGQWHISREISTESYSRPETPLLESPGSAMSTMCMVVPMNRLCPERRYILRRSGRSGTHAKLSVSPLCRIPLWMTHTERGDISSAQKDLAGLLPLPCYGIALGPDADKCHNLDDLVAAQCAALLGMQPSGPYLIMGTSVVGCVLAHAIAIKLKSYGHLVGLIMLDGCVGVPSMPLHDPTWYALFYLLREIGTLKGRMGEFVDFVRGAGTPTRQLKLISSFKPPEVGISAEAWDAAVYATLDRAAVLKRLVKPLRVELNKDPESQASSRSPKDFDGPAAVILPRDRLGSALLQASEKQLSNTGGIIHVPLESRHTECLLTASARSATASALSDAVLSVLRRLDI